MEALSEKGIHLKMGAERFPTMASGSSLKGWEVGKYLGRKMGRQSEERSKFVALWRMRANTKEETKEWVGDVERAEV